MTRKMRAKALHSRRSCFEENTLFWFISTMLLRLLYISVTFVGIFGQLEIDNVFDLQDIDAIQSPECEQVVGELDGCHSCYPCDHPTVTYYKHRNEEVRTLVLNTKKCVPSTVCCVNQVSYVSRLGDTCFSACGTRNINGVGPRMSRTGPRSLLTGEFPWAAYIFRKINNKLVYICSATFINEMSLVFVTSAACVRGIKADNLTVRFDRHVAENDIGINVKNVIVHNDYVAELGSNNIALVVLRDSNEIPSWSRPICLPSADLPQGTPCTALTDNNLLINTVVPQRKLCEIKDESQTCSFSPPFDYAPAHGTGLYCEVDCEGTKKYKLFGVASKIIKNEVTIHADVHNLLEWILKNNPRA